MLGDDLSEEFVAVAAVLEGRAVFLMSNSSFEVLFVESPWTSVKVPSL
jgi:hypothetical protein